MKFEIEQLLKKLKKFKDSIDQNTLTSSIEKMEEEINVPGFWDNPQKAKELKREYGQLQKKLDKFEEVCGRIQDLEAYKKMYKDKTLTKEDKNFVRDEIREIEGFYSNLRRESYLAGKYDTSDAIVTIKSGQGGTEAQDWVQILFRMYSKYIESQGWKLYLLDKFPGKEAGFSKVVFEVSGEYAYGYLKHETGVHRLVRKSPFNAQGLRQTSFASVEVMPNLDKKDLGNIKLDSSDLEIKFTTSGGPGGQYTNKRKTAVRIVHKTTGIVASCSSERSQQQNKEKAEELLVAKLVTKLEEEQETEIDKLKKNFKDADWGNQIRNYILDDNIVKDLRTGVERGDPESVLNGDLDDFIKAEIEKL